MVAMFIGLEIQDLLCVDVETQKLCGFYEWRYVHFIDKNIGMKIKHATLALTATRYFLESSLFAYTDFISLST